jgi:hypothetical protein
MRGNAAKWCPACERELPHDAFSKDRSTKSGLRAYCRECSSEKARERYYANPKPVDELERRRARARAWNHANRKRKMLNRDIYRARWPERESARNAVRYALRMGRMERQPCEVCGDPKSQAHHDDYAKKLEVRWLCQTHHAEADVERRRREREENRDAA